MSLKHLGNCKVVALYTTEVQTEKNSLSRSLYYILFTIFTLFTYLLYFLSRIFSGAVSLSLRNTRSLLGTVAHRLSRAHFRPLSRTVALSQALSVTLARIFGLSLAHFRSVSRAVGHTRSLSRTFGLSLRSLLF